MRVATRNLAALLVAMLWVSVVQSGAQAQQAGRKYINVASQLLADKAQ